MARVRISGSDSNLAGATERRTGAAWLDQLSAAQVLPKGSREHQVPVFAPRRDLITPSTRIGSIGSCFSREIKGWLTRHGYNYVQIEEGPTSVYGSGRFGVLVDSDSLRQQFDAAEGRFDPTCEVWHVKGKLADPFRKNIVWDCEETRQRELSEHVSNVSSLGGSCDVLVITLGSSEVWRDLELGCTFAAFPPLDILDPSRHVVHVLTPQEHMDNLASVYASLRAANPDLQLIVTLSPIRAPATARPMSVWEANSASKASLRTGLDLFCEAHPEVIYFPSYEIVTDLEASPWRRDNRHVAGHTVDRIMRTFLSSYSDLAAEPVMQDEAPEPGAPRDSLEAEFRTAFVLAKLEHLADRVDGRPVAIFGAGRHTRHMLEWVHGEPGMPRFEMILDDAAQPGQHLAGRPVTRPELVEAGRFAAVVVSSDAHEPALARRAAAWASTAAAQPEVVTLYDRLPTGPYPHSRHVGGLDEAKPRPAPLTGVRHRAG